MGQRSRRIELTLEGSTMRALLVFINRLIELAVLILLAVMCVYFLYSGILGVIGELKLRKSGVVTVAAITDIRPASGNVRDAEYDVRCQFTVEGEDTIYTCADDLGRRNLWHSPSQEGREEIEWTNQISVIYVPSDPWINRPLSDRDTMSGALMAIWIGMVDGVLFAALVAKGQRLIQVTTAVLLLFSGFSSFIVSYTLFDACRGTPVQPRWFYILTIMVFLLAVFFVLGGITVIVQGLRMLIRTLTTSEDW